MLFSDWLLRQKMHEDSVGKLAQRLIRDSTGPLWTNDPETYRRYLAARGADEGLCQALERALTEWLRHQLGNE